MSLTKVRKAKKLLNRYAPKGEQLAFINSKEAKLLKKLGGAGVNIKGTGIKSYFDDSGDDYGGYDSGSSSSSSNDNNSDNDSGSSYDYIPQQFTPAPTPTPTQTFADDDYTLTPEETKEQQDTISSSIDDLKNTIEDDGTSLYTTTPDYTYDEKKGIYSAPTFQGPYVDSRNDPFTTAKNTDTGIFSKIGSGLKTAAKIALPFVAGPIAGALGLAKPYQAYSTFNRGKKGLDYISKLSKGRVPTSADLLKNINFQKGPSVKGPPTGFNDNDSNEGNALVANNVIAKNIQKYSPAQVKSLQNNINLLSSVMDKGQYQGIQLNSSQLSQVSNQRNSLIEQYKTIQESLV
jgi:hypothetical protein